MEYGRYLGTLRLYVVKGSGPTLLGRDWLSKIQLDWNSIKAVAVSMSLSQMLERFQPVLEPGMGVMTQLTAHLTLKEHAEPRFFKPHPIPFAIKDRVGRELDRLEKSGVLHRVDYADWAAPIVPVPKKDGSLRLCGDYKVTINPTLRVDQYPLPRPADLIACLTGGRRFSNWISLLHISKCLYRCSLTEARDHQYPSRFIPVYAASFWCCLGTCRISASHGHHPPGCPRSYLLPGRYFGNGEVRRRASAQPGDGAEATSASRSATAEGQMCIPTIDSTHSPKLPSILQHIHTVLKYG